MDQSWALESIQPYHARLLFSTPTAQFEMFDFIQSRKWTVEWTGEHLLAYAVGKIVSPEELKYFAGDMVELIGLLRKADDEADSKLDARIAASAQR